ncbi:MAG: hypothetical protein PHW76_01760 [Alphaproteobacteria bacterium]|nr:hypothetical protein [Alphaproteobacteria bacterium]
MRNLKDWKNWAAERILLMVGEEGVIVVPHGIEDGEPFFAASESELAAHEVMDYLAQHPRARVTLLADTFAQDYCEDDLPPLSFFDKPRLVRRRLQQKYGSATLAAYLSFKKTPHRVLMIGLHEPSPLFAWAKRTQERLPDISLLPVEGAKMLARLMPEAASGWAMLLSRQKTGGFRQIVTYKNDLVFTRLTAASDHEEGLAQDVKATIDYLARLGLKGADPMSLLVLASKDAPAPKLPEFGSIHYLTPAEAATRLKLGLIPADDDPAADILFASHFLSNPRPRLSLMLPETRVARQKVELQRWGSRLAYGGLAVALLATVWRASDLANTMYQAQKEAFELTKGQRLLDETRQKAGPLTEPLGIMREALERRRIYDAPRLEPWHALNELSSGLDWKSRVSKIEWRVEGASESVMVALRLPDDEDSGDRADKVAAFTALTQAIAGAMSDYRLAEIKPPYPSLPNEAVTATQETVEVPDGQVRFERHLP